MFMRTINKLHHLITEINMYLSSSGAEAAALRTLVTSRYEPDDRIGSGSFGKIFRGRDTQTGEWVAIKLEKKRGGTTTLQKEAKVMAEMQDIFGFPKMLHFSKDDNYNVIIMDHLGYDLEKLLKLCNYKLSNKTVFMLADQMITRLESLHSRGYLHRDIKPENFVMGLGKQARNLYLIDFGLAKPWKDTDGKHIQMRDDKGMVGTARYASISTLTGFEPSRRDDMESLGYTLIYLLKGKLPWQNLKLDDGSDKYAKIAQAKRATPLGELCKDIPKSFIEYMKLVRNLEFTETPPYKSLKKVLRTEFCEQGCDFDYQYDWVVNQILIHDPTQRTQLEKQAKDAGKLETSLAAVANKGAVPGQSSKPAAAERKHKLTEVNHNMKINEPLPSSGQISKHMRVSLLGSFKEEKEPYTIKVIQPEIQNLTLIPMLPSALEESVISNKAIQLNKSQNDEIEGGPTFKKVTENSDRVNETKGKSPSSNVLSNHLSENIPCIIPEEELSEGKPALGNFPSDELILMLIADDPYTTDNDFSAKYELLLAKQVTLYVHRCNCLNSLGQARSYFE
jgi:serine/threonine protein kinase